VDTILGEDSDQYALDAETRKSLERKRDYVSCYLALGGTETPGDTQRKLVRRRSTWSRHTGLYDGTGYATSDCNEDDRAAPKSPQNTIDNPSTQSTTPPGESVATVIDEKQALQDIIREYSMYASQEKERVTTNTAVTSFENGSKEHIRAASQPVGAVGLPHKVMAMSIEA
jgi:hypothetical protein